MPERIANTGPRPKRSRRLRAAQLVTAAAMLLLAFVLLGCGEDDDGNGDGGDGSFPPNVVTDEELEAQEEGSPGRALLEWWQAFQFGDSTQVVSLTSQETLNDVGEKDLEDLVKNRGQDLQGVEVLETSEEGDTASVRVGLLTFTPEKEGDPPPDEPTASQPDTFELVQEDGDWLFAETAYLEPMIEALKAAQEEQEEGGGE